MNSVKILGVLCFILIVMGLAITMARILRGPHIPGWIELETFLMDNSPVVEAWIGTPPVVALVGIIPGGTGTSNGCGFSMRESVCGSSSSVFIGRHTMKDVIMIGSRRSIASIRCTPDYTPIGAITSLDGYFAVCPDSERIIARCSVLYIRGQPLIPGEKEEVIHECSEETKQVTLSPNSTWAIVSCDRDGNAIQFDPLGIQVRGYRDIEFSNSPRTPISFYNVGKCKNTSNMDHILQGRREDCDEIATEIHEDSAKLRRCAPCDTTQSSVLLVLAFGYLTLIAILAAPQSTTKIVAIMALSIHLEFSLGYGMGAPISSMLSLPQVFVEIIFAAIIILSSFSVLVEGRFADAYAVLSILTACWYASHGVHNFIVRYLITFGTACAASVAATTPTIQLALIQKASVIHIIITTLTVSAVAILAIDPIISSIMSPSWTSFSIVLSATFISTGFASLIYAIRRLHHVPKQYTK
jgi:hypothetical protein